MGKQRERDLCPGFQANHTGVNGICCCGLWWEGTMPAHDAKGRALKLERIVKRKVRRAELQWPLIEAGVTIKGTWRKLGEK